MKKSNNNKRASCVLPMKLGRRQAGAASGVRASPSLRPPTLMIDLLFGALMLFAFQMGDPSAKTTIAHDIDLPTSDQEAPQTGRKLMALKPVSVGSSGWRYELQDGRRIGPEEVLRITRSEKKTPVLLIAAETSVKRAIEAQTPLRKLGVKVGLAVSVVKGDTK